MNSVYEKEVAQREEILDKVYNNIKISPEERIWLVTHSLYNERLGQSAFNIVIEHIFPNKWYLLRISIESILYDKRIIPIISVPAAKGKIVTDLELIDCDGEVKAKKPIKTLGIELNKNVCEYEVEYFSDLGLLSVEYECDYFDEETKLYMCEASSTGNPDFAMIRQVIDDHKVRYYCKSPIAHSFDALVFTIQWEGKTYKTGDGSRT